MGAGVEHKIGRTTYAKIEYRYSNYGNARLEYADGANTNNFSVDTDRHRDRRRVWRAVLIQAACFAAQIRGRDACPGPFYV